MNINKTNVQIAIIGMGPRGTIALERICASVPEFLAPDQRLIIHAIDPSPPGAGSVWRTNQSPHLLMNTVTSQVTLFTDASVECAGPIRPGPTLYDWARKYDHAVELGPDDYSTRALYGHYLEWAFGEAVRRAPSNVKVETHTARAVQLDDTSSSHQSVRLSTGQVLTGIAAVVLSQGHLPLKVDPAQQEQLSYAAEHGLRYVPPISPADVDLSSVAPGEPVLLRGLGLNFFDYMALFTIGRGGSFTRTPQGLVYHPSGKEPRMYAGSRRGVPYHARADNVKGAYGRHIPLVLTEEVILNLQARSRSGSGLEFERDVWPLVAKEVEAVYYDCLLREKGTAAAGDFQRRFLALPHAAAADGAAQEEEGGEEEALLAEFGLAASAERWSWARLAHPYGARAFAGGAPAWQAWLLGHLDADAREAARGNAAGPLKAALDVLRDLRNEVRRLVDHGGLAPASHRAHLAAAYSPLNAYLSIGPPRARVEQLAALVRAGALTVLGPGLEVRPDAGGPAWTARSPRVPGSAVRGVTTLIEARLPAPDARRTADPLLAHLLRTGQGRAHRVVGGGDGDEHDYYETGGLDVTEAPYRVLDAAGRPHPRRFALGVPTEGVRWATAAGARPGVNSVALADADAVARAALGLMSSLHPGSKIAAHVCESGPQDAGTKHSFKVPYSCMGL
ncbi:FAD-NAD(P)-binding-domain-containing protein [Xylariomycetidae sp. FL0641]|nr:FAD-NAD(P)-binding-domain-containing protein [Xylariomycetidae sp. FL0641]